MSSFKLKRKCYAAPLLALGSTALNTAMVGSTIYGIKQGSDQMQQSEELAKEQEKQNKSITKALNNIAAQAKNNPQAAIDAASVMSQKSFAAPSGSVMGAIKDIGKVAFSAGRRKHLATNVVMGAGIAAGGYAANKYIEKDMKKNGITNDQLQQMRSAEQRGYSIMESVKSKAKKAGGVIKGQIPGTAMMAGLGGIPTVLSYHAEKSALKDQIAATSSSNPAQRSYAVPFAGIGKNIGKAMTNFKGTAKKNWQSFNAHRGRSTLSWISKNLAMGGGHKGVQNFGKDLASQASKSGNVYTKKAADFIANNPKTALAGSIGVGATAMGVTFGAGEKAFKGVAKGLDKNAYAYEDIKNQQIG